MNPQQLSDQLPNSTDSLPDVLVQAARAGHLATVNGLLARGIDPDATDNLGHTALVAATWNGYTDIVRALLINGASPDESKALIPASHCGHLEIVELLLAHRADPNIQGLHGETALHWASFDAHVDIVNALLSGGANPNIVDQNDRDAFSEAALHGRTAIVKVFLARCAECTKSTSALRDAARSGSVEIVKELLAHGIRPNKSPAALIEAVDFGNLAIVEELLAHGANPNASDRFGRVALHRALQKRRREIALVLLDNGTSPSPSDLLAAARLGYGEVVQKLLDLGVDPNALSGLECTALCKAAQNGHLDVVNILLEKGADPNALQETGTSALCRAVISGSTDTVNTLLANGATPGKSPDALVEAVSRGQWEIINTLLANGARPDKPDKANRTALGQARFAGHECIIRLLEKHIPTGPDSLLLMARTCIRTRLIESKRDRLQSMNSLIAELPLPSLHKRYVYGPLIPQAGSPGEYLKNDHVYSDAKRAEISF